MTDVAGQARALLQAFKGDAYIYGVNCLDRLGEQVAALGRRAALVASGTGKGWGVPLHAAVAQSLAAARVRPAGDPIRGAAPNAPREDVFRIEEALRAQEPDVVVAVGGGSGIDAAKAAVARLALSDRHPDLMDYFGLDRASAMLEATGRRLLPMVAVQIAASSAAHLTKYANITDTKKAQKLLIVDEAMVPPRALFDYAVTRTMSAEFTADGGLDGVSHCLEVYFGAPEGHRAVIEPVALLGLELIVGRLARACRDSDDMDARVRLGLGTDLGGYAIMLGGTNGAHLTSFSLVDILSHGRACALMNPYYTVFFAPVIEDRVRRVGAVYKTAGFSKAGLDRLHGRTLGLAVAEAMLNLSRAVGLPTRLADVPGFTEAHIARALEAAKNPKLESKLRNMPVPMTAYNVDEYMGPLLEAARTGNLETVKNMPS